ncbi:MAG: type I pullulanase [bacterium]|nr:type I pullulanase [bacterium]
MKGQLTIHYLRFLRDYEGWTLWTWITDDPGSAQEVHATHVDAHGAVFNVPVPHDHVRVGFLPKFRQWEGKDGPDRFWEPGQPRTLYLIEGDEEVYTSAPPREPWLRRAYADTATLVHVTFNRPVGISEVRAELFEFWQGEEGLGVGRVRPTEVMGSQGRSYAVELACACDLEALRLGRVRVRWRHMRECVVLPRYVWDDPQWKCDLPLGPYVDAEHLFLRVWAPAAQMLRVVLGPQPPLPPPGDPHRLPQGGYEMEYKGRGVWELKLFGDYRNWYYRLESVLVHDPTRVVAVIDPYARAVDRRERAGVLVDDHTSVTAGPTFPFADAIIYEAHVRDFTNDVSSGVKHAGTYRGFVERGTHVPHVPEVSTGLDHLCALGVNTVQLMPVHLIDMDERESEHAWGYMPLHYNAPETVYASDRSPVTAVRELKEMVDALHRAGIKVVLDVVYNHSTESRTHAVHWNGLAPDYFYRARPDGSYYNGSGCGNEFRSEGTMARVFLLDSLKYWMREYGVDGFRFDLMGLIDIETMRLVVRELRSLRADVFLYGEPWAGGDTPIRVTQKGDQRSVGFSCFNDRYRNAIVGNVFDNSPGYVYDGRGREEIQGGWCGSGDWFTEAPSESINYVECHDNRTLRDKLADVSRAHQPEHSEEDRLAEDRLAAFLVLLAQGVPFLHAGQEFYRTKFGEHNSYNLGDRVNNVRWTLKAEYSPLYEYYRGLIALRKAHPLFRNRTRTEVEKRIFFGVVKPPYIVCELDGMSLGDSWRRALVLINPTPMSWSYAVPEGRAWHVYVAGSRAAATPLYALGADHHVIAVPPRSAFLMAEHR